MSIFHFFHNNFEYIIIMAVGVFAAALLGVILVQIRVINWRRIFQAAFSNFLFFTVVFSEVLLILLCGYIYWTNYLHKGKNTIDKKLEYTTHWVKDTLPAYYLAHNELITINLDGSNNVTVFEAKDEINEYHFSPDGRYILIATNTELILFDRLTNKPFTVESPPDAVDLTKFKSVIRDVRWSPDSERFVYQMSIWTGYSSLNNYYIFNVTNNRKRAIKSPVRFLPNLSWDKEGEVLYYFEHKALDPQRHVHPYTILLFKISMADLNPEKVLTFAWDSPSLTAEEWSYRDILLYDEPRQLSFRKDKSETLTWKAKDGRLLGIDQDNYLYYVPHRWWRKRLFYIPRIQPAQNFPHYDYGGGVPVVEFIQWLPGGKYALVAHKELGILILEPSSAKIGQLVSSYGQAFGWYQE